MNLKDKPFYLSDKQITWVENTLKEMTVDQKIGQLFCILGDAYEKEELNLGNS